MGYYDKDMFEYEFAIRTAYNLKHIKEEVKKQNTAGKKDEDVKVYEVTQLINSFIGLLTLPKEKQFDYLDWKKSFPRGSSAEMILEKLNTGKCVVEDTYMVKVEDGKYIKPKRAKRITAKDLIRRMRNAISHGNFSVYPEKPGIGNEIKALRFEDNFDLIGSWNDDKSIFTADKNGKDICAQKFSVVFSIQEVEQLLFAMCRLLIEHYPEGPKNWPEDLGF